MPIKPAATKPRLRAADGSFSARGTVTSKVLRKIWTSPLTAPKQVAQFSDTRKPVEFYTDFASTNVDSTNGIIRGVAVITSGVIARGHDLEVDATTLAQIKTCAEAKGQVPVKIDHKSGAAAVCGFLTNFHLDGDKLKADWHLLKTHPQKDTILEVAERMPKGVGLSASFLPPSKGEKAKSGNKAARCEELLSVDYVTLPAANPNGMFSAKVDTPQTANPNMTPEQIAEIVKQSIAEALAPVTEQLEALKTQQDLLANPPTLDELAEMSDEQLAKLGITAEEVAEALAQAQDGAEEGEELLEGAGEGNDISAAGAEAAAAPAALQAVLKEVQGFAAELRKAKAEREQAEQDAVLEDIEVQFEAACQQITELQAQLTTGGKPVSHGAGAIQFKSKTGTPIEFGTKEPGDFEKAVVEKMNADSALTKSKAFAAVIRENKDAYQDYLARRGLVKA